MSRKDISNISLKSVKLGVKNSELENSNSKKKRITRKHEDFVAGIAPNLRGSYSTMYVRYPWTIRQYANFSTTEDNNALYRNNIIKELPIAFNLAVHQENDANNKYIKGNIGKSDIFIDSVEDMKVLLNQIPLDKTPVSITMNALILPILAFYIVTAEEQGISQKLLSGTIQNEILKKSAVQNTYIYPPKTSTKIIADIFKYTAENMPKFNSFSISGDYQETHVGSEIKLAYTLANGLEFIKKGLEAGIDIDSLAPRLSFSWITGTNHFQEIAKMRAGRMLWAKIVKKFNPKNLKSMALRTHCTTNKSNLTEQDPFNNIARTTIEAMTSAFGGTQSLYTNAFNESFALPTNFSARLALNTQIYLQEETYITKTIDPWAGSYEIEKLTEEIAHKAWELIKEIEEIGGMTKAIEKGITKIHIEKVKIDNSQDAIIGAKTYQLKKDDSQHTLKANNETVREYQIERLNNLKSKRNEIEVDKSLANLTECAKTSKGNLLHFAVKATRNRATLSEITNALKILF